VVVGTITFPYFKKLYNMRVIETPQDMQVLMRECMQVTDYYVDMCNSKFGLHLPRFQIVFSLKTGTAGKAFIGKNVIAFNPTLLRQNPEAFLKRTPGHEVVHFAAYAYHGPDISGHGSEWKSMMVKLGLDPTPCHNYDTTLVPSRVGKVPNKRTNSTIKSDTGVITTIGIGKIIEFD
jgi:predicted SprT family Zn-dependent metalloprotease